MSQSATPFRTAQQKEEERRTKRNAVLRAAVQMFNKQGFHATSLEDVATSLGITKPTIYHYLGNKDQVLLECLTIGLQQLLDAADIARSMPGTGIDRLKRFLHRYAEINMEDFGRCVIRTGDEVLSRVSAKRYRELKREIDNAIRSLIVEAIDDGSISPGDPKLIAFTLAGALNWPARWHDPDGALSATQIAEQMVEILTHGLAPR